MSAPSREVLNRSRRRIYKRQTIDLHKEMDADIIQRLEEVGNKQAYLKGLVRDDIRRRDMEDCERRE